jgi:hypothetical protein
MASVSCSKKELGPQETEMGVLSMQMNLSDATKAMSEDDLRNSAVVNIYKADFSGLVRSYKYSEIPSPFYLAADSYRVDVVAGESASETPSAASWRSISTG